MFVYVFYLISQLFLIDLALGRVLPTHKGCFWVEGGQRLDGYVVVLHSLSPDDCLVICFNQGYTHAALRDGNECSCGDVDSLASLPESEDCSTPCAGSPKDICGGPRSYNLYSTGMKDVSLEVQRIGCISDGAVERLIPQHKIDLPHTNSPSKCVAICKSLGYKHAGLQRSYECYCGEADRLGPLESGCSAPCPADPNLQCGGNWKMMLYKSGILPGIPNTKIEYMACFKNRVGGVLRRHKFVDQKMDPFKCIAKCFSLGHPYAALFNRTECQCGRLPVPLPTPVDEDLCSLPCPGDVSKMCGGPEHVAGYTTGIIGDPVMGRSIGCYKDDDGSLISGVSFDAGFRNNPKFCIAKCIQYGYMLAGVRNTYECACGNQYPRNVPRVDVDSSRCNSSCVKSNLWTCGGPTTVQAYRTGLDDMYSDRGCPKSATEVDGGQTCRGELVFEETFDKLRPSIWQRTIRISGEDFEFVTYNSDERNAFIRNGRLVIKPTLLEDSFVLNGSLTLRGCTGRPNSDECAQQAYSYSILHPVQSAQLCTSKSFGFRYGQVTVRAKLSGGDWVVSEIFLKPHREVYGPGYLSGKLTIASGRGNDALTTAHGEDIGSHVVEAGISVGSSDDPASVITKNVLFKSNTPWYSEFHNYTVLWDTDSISHYIDNKITQMKSVYNNEKDHLVSELGITGSDRNTWKDGSRLAPFDEKFQICFGVSVGGSRSFPDGSVSGNKPKPWENFSLKSMLNFWKARNDWLTSWLRDLRFEVDHVSVTAI